MMGINQLRLMSARPRVAQPHRWVLPMSRTAIVLVALMLGGCDSGSQRVLDFLTGHDSNVVVLTQQPMVITHEMATLTSSEAMKVVGELTSVCFALRGGLPLQNSNIMDREFKSAMHGAKVKVIVEFTTRDRLPLDQPMMAWNLNGKIVGSDELSACASTACPIRLPVGAQVSRIEVSSDSSLAVQGIYWTSERGPLEKAALPGTGGGASASPKLDSGCRAHVSQT
jgi:hypothetical protein